MSEKEFLRFHHENAPSNLSPSETEAPTEIVFLLQRVEKVLRQIAVSDEYRKIRQHECFTTNNDLELEDAIQAVNEVQDAINLVRETFKCDKCDRLVPWQKGADNDMPNACDDCWAKAHSD
ncbi:hypothetical protein [Cylindrospermum sp. FACHB-282]|uniref:hypothetical protein n=1 Tax=Cylindrospermum sp. FACHB-282 TaxID=2692794 RepID=UPI001991ABAF|nr:hypothetical protein [Cylindrospermum sp. FACHB-282]MBD2386039.1 hypothetical protein [Cylindrospermum sp. FACHB-282]